MKAPILTGIIDRRILLNFRADPAVVSQLLPSPFRAQLVQGQAMVGICLIRLKDERPKGFPAAFGMESENGAHRFAVEWDAAGQLHKGVYIPRRDTSSRLNFLFGNQLLGIHHHSTFQVSEQGGNYSIAFQSPDGTRLAVEARETTEWPATSLFSTLEQASGFFQQGAAGYSPKSGGKGFDGVELSTSQWQVSPLVVQQVSSSFFADEALFPVGSVVFDNALLMRNVAHEWHRLQALPGSATSCV
jgi:hypothetical protein